MNIIIIVIIIISWVFSRSRKNNGTISLALRPWVLSVNTLRPQIWKLFWPYNWARCLDIGWRIIKNYICRHNFIATKFNFVLLWLHADNMCDVNKYDSNRRRNCGWKGITKTECENRGCCFDDAIYRNHTPTYDCYYPLLVFSLFIFVNKLIDTHHMGMKKFLTDIS